MIFYSTAVLTGTIEILFKKPFIDESRCATDPGIDTDGGGRAIPGTGAALHAAVEVDDPGSVFHERKDLMRTDLQTPAAADASLLIQLQRGHIVQITETIHRFSSLPLQQLTRQ
jgi:hypothetical protein